ncbi:MAG: ACP phosphodiesterase [Cytophagaceae bacterium]|nr:ACP phosphodiesterase [Cytophagaceae bacterium]
MNYLAHTYLSGSDDELKLGNFLGDFVKGRVGKYTGLGVTERVRQGIRLHRAIDSFTDQHPIFRRSKSRLVPRYGLLSGVIVDLFYDHFLAVDWAGFSPQPLPEFSRQFYELLHKNILRLPPEMHRMVEAMSTYNWLAEYARIKGVEQSLKGLAQRVPAASGIGTAGEELSRNYAEFQEDFREFFPELRLFCRNFIHEFPSN